MAFGTGEGHAFEAWQLHFAARFGGWKAANLGGGFLSVQKTALGTTGCWQRGASALHCHGAWDWRRSRF